MGFRNATVRQLKVPDLTTTVLPLNVTGLAAGSSLAGGINSNWGCRIAGIAAIFGGLALPLVIAGALVPGEALDGRAQV